MPTKTRINGENYTQIPRLVSDDIVLKGLPQTAGAPDGYGDLALNLSSVPVSVKAYGAKGDGVTDDTAAIQAAVDGGGSLFFPAGVYIISSPINIRTNNGHSIVGEVGNKPQSIIRTSTIFSGFSMFRQWDQSWYAGGETNFDVPPADLSAYTNLIDRYLNISNIQFDVNSNTNRITCIDLVAMHETSLIYGCVFRNMTTQAGSPIRFRATPAGSEVSANGFNIEKCVVYGAGWRSQLVLLGRGSDINVSEFTTSPSACVESPIQTGVVSTKLNNLHCEASATALPTVNLSSGDTTLVSPLFVVQSNQGDILKTTVSSGTNARVGFVATGMRILIAQSATGISSINVMESTGTATSLNRVLPLYISGDPISMIGYLDRNEVSGVQIGNGAPVRFPLDPAAPQEKLIQFIPTSGTTTTVVPVGTGNVVITDELLKRGSIDILWSAGSTSGAVGNDYFNNPQSGRITMAISSNGSEWRRKVRIYTDGGPAIFGNPVWSHTAGTLTLDTLISFTNARFWIKVIGGNAPT